MHFSKTYAQILEGLPPGLRDNAIQYRQLKKIINQVVSELSSLGLSPELLQELIADHTSSTITLGQLDLLAAAEAASHPFRLADLDPLLFNQARVKYEVVEHSDRLEPHLRLWVTLPDAPSVPTPPAEPSFEEVEDLAPDSKLENDHARNLLSGLQSQLERVDDASIVSSDSETSIPSKKHHSPLTHEVIIPLVSDTKFFNNLSTALESMSSHLSIVHHDFLKSLGDLSRTISQTALPSSASPSFSPHSALTSHAGSIQVTNSQPSKSDLYSWREIFQLYVESEVFEHIGEYHRKERSLEESEERLKLFVEQATKRGLADRRNFKLKQSRVALQQFIEMNLFILNIKKFSEASSEATRKILKKHTKRTSLPLPSPFSSPTNTTSAPASTALTTTTESSPFLLFSKFSTTSLPRMFVQAIGETLIPIIPHLDDYACLICTAIAFKPIRLSCGHLFCVRCLVKMQKRNKGDCPMCRAPVVLSANGSNVDWALLNFMQDWFPVEAREKLKANEREASDEELRELGIDPNKACVIM
ncbi:RING-14 protein [Coprinopsis sp. MPI-PUGE-AT-0042]|nr:RING-14 protein [Coprinopsis sp. MPI-PUGE-AT-0042]